MNSDLFKRIGTAFGVPGHEDDIQELIFDELSACCDEVYRDHMGNVFGVKKARKAPPKGKRPVRLMLAAHADEIGFMVKHIAGNGYIHFIQIGGQNYVVAQSQRVIIHGNQPVRGIIAPGHQADNAPGKLEELVIDTGLSKEELEKLIKPGDVISWDSDVSILNGKMWVGRNFDNRMGSYTMTQAMREVGDTPVDVYAVSTVQEEVGLRGARPAAFGVAPDIGIAIDGSMTRQAYAKEFANLCEPGKGTGIYVIDNLTIGHRHLVQYMFDLCKKRDIACQRNLGGGTDASAIQQSRAGVIATTIGAPVRYMHSTCQLVHADDLDATVGLLVGMMQTADKFYAQLLKQVRGLKDSTLLESQA